MNLINFSKANCRSCYKCIRICPVKAIKFKDDQAEIVEDRCIACGQCLIECPQNARYIKSDVLKVKEAIENKKVIATIAPSFAGAFDMTDEGQIVTALKTLGFDIVEETAVGARIVTAEYNNILTDWKYNNVITTCCPSANYLIERYFPSLTKYMLPVVSPMLAHGKVLKHIYGMESFVVFLGPCTAKKYEAIDFQHDGIIDAVVTFEEFALWLKEENIDIKSLESQKFDRRSVAIGRKYPVKNGVISGLMPWCTKNGFEPITVDGIEDCVKIMKEIENGDIKNVCVEVNICRGSCSGGPGMPDGQDNYFKCQSKVKEYMKKSGGDTVCENVDLSKIDFANTFLDKSIAEKKVSDDEIRKILKSMGKYEERYELNCGVCGYDTCREKAIAIYNGMAETNMCLNYMRNKAESLTNVIFGNSPNIIIILDEDLNIIEFNPAAEKAFKIESEYIKNKPISIILGNNELIEALSSKEDIFSQKASYKEYDLITLQNIIHLEKQGIILLIMSDSTEEEKNKKELKMVKENTLNAAQEVIDKQMRVVQEIASLLGETTAETKVILTKLKKIAEGEEN